MDSNSTPGAQNFSLLAWIWGLTHSTWIIQLHAPNCTKPSAGAAARVSLKLCVLALLERSFGASTGAAMNKELHQKYEG